MARNKFNEGDILVLKNKYSYSTNFKRCKIKHIIINQGNHDGDYYAVTPYPEEWSDFEWYDMSGVHAYYDLDNELHRTEQRCIV